MMFSFFTLLALTIALVSWKEVVVTSAIHAEGDYCYFYTHDAGMENGELSRGTFKYVENKNNATLTCKAKGVNVYSSAEIIRGESNLGLPGACTIAGVTNGMTYDWHVTVSPNGNATAVCHIDKN